MAFEVQSSASASATAEAAEQPAALEQAAESSAIRLPHLGWRQLPEPKPEPEAASQVEASSARLISAIQIPHKRELQEGA